VYGVAAKEVLDGDIADLGSEPVAFDDFGETGDGPPAPWVTARRSRGGALQ